MTDVATILIRGFCLLLMASLVLSGILFIVGETVEHFTP